VIYLSGGREFREFDRAWIAVYAQALGRALGRPR
jgi:hypothetical protein